MIERIPKSAVAAAGVLGAAVLAYLAYSSPGYFTSQTYISGIVLLELLLAAVYFYRRVFFPAVLISFLFAGLNLPVGPGWTTARWLFLGVGAGVGVIMVALQGTRKYGLFHAFALLAVTTALVSAAVSPYPMTALMKCASLLLLFVYTASGVRVTVTGRENQFFTGLLLGAEIFVAVIMGFYLIGIAAMGNPNALGAVMGVFAAPILLWGVMLNERRWLHWRHTLAYSACLYLVLLSRSRAGIAAVAFSFVLYTVCLRRYRLLMQGLGIGIILAATLAIFVPEYFSTRVQSFTADVVHKGNLEDNIFASRVSPWQATLDTIHEHFWFGTGFGTTDTGADATEHLGRLASSSDISTEHGSSYLALASWVGILGLAPFFLLLTMLLKKTFETFVWMLRTRNPAHPSVPLAVLVLAGLLHAGFEDWLFAPGNYLCVYFWSMAFILVDFAPSTVLVRPSVPQQTGAVQPTLNWSRNPSF